MLVKGLSSETIIFVAVTQLTFDLFVPKSAIKIRYNEYPLRNVTMVFLII